MTTTIPEELFKYVFFLAIGLVITYFLDRYFRIRPKVIADIKGGPIGKWSSHPGSLPNQIEMNWQRKLILINNTKHDALEIQLLWPNDKALLDIKVSAHTNIPSRSKIEIPFVVKKSFPHHQVVAAGSTRESLIPPELKKTQFVLTYSSEKGKKFYTLFKFQEGSEPHNSFYRSMPRV